MSMFLGHKRVCDWSKSGDENARKLDEIPRFFQFDGIFDQFKVNLFVI